MFRTQIFELSYEALILIMVLSAPPVLISMLFGLTVAIFQAATQIQEQTLSFTVKLVAIIITLILMGSWLGSIIMQFANKIFTNIPKWS